MQQRDKVAGAWQVVIINSKQNVVLNMDEGGFAAVEWFVGWL